MDCCCVTTDGGVVRIRPRRHEDFASSGTMTNPTAMSEPLKSPIIFEPILKRILWGGRRLEALFGKRLGPESDYAESWELADHPNGRSLALLPEALAGKELGQLVREHPQEILGPALAKRFQQFPLLIKFLDAHQVLSLQVHPNDALGHRLVGDNGKNEAWVVLHAEPGSRIYAGLKPGVTRQEFESAMKAHTVSELVHSFEPVSGDCIMIPAGTVHAIGAGIVLAEIQQMSDATFRVDDWGRVGPDGRPRQLHLAEALEATDFERGPVGPWVPRPVPTGNPAVQHEELARCPYFEINRWQLHACVDLGDADYARFTVLIILSGEVEVQSAYSNTLKAGRGTTVLLPAAAGACRVTPVGPETAELLACGVPQ